MPTMLIRQTREAAILSRAIKPREKTLPPPVAKALLKLELDERDRIRLHELAQKNQAGRLSSEDELDLQSYLSVGMLLDLLQAKARLSIKKETKTR